MNNTLYRKMLRRPIQGMPGFGGQTQFENITNIAITGYFHYLCTTGSFVLFI